MRDHQRQVWGWVTTAVLLLSVLLPGSAVATASLAQQGLTFSPPLGHGDGQRYAPRVERDSAGELFEDTGFAAQNPDLVGATCFGVAWEQTYHAGQDLYRADGSSTAGAEVTAVADGVVAYANPNLNYPGLVVIVEHALPEGDKLFSVYAHLNHNSLEVQTGDRVTLGQRLGTVMYQRYAGRFPERHPTRDDSHLHFEMRRFLSARDIYHATPACNGLVAGRGYTYPEHPSDFPAPAAGYEDPARWISP